MPARTTRRGLLGLGATLALSAVLAGCTLPDVGMSPGLSEAAATESAASHSAEATASAPATPTTAAAAESTATRPTGDLDTGSVTHSVQAGDRTVVVDYWTDQDAKTWTAAGDKTIQLSAHIENDTSEQEVKVTRFVATSDDGSSRTTVTEDRGEFVLTPPFSYTTALSVAPSAATATAVTLYVQIELLVETEPGSGEWFRQTVLDSIQLPLLQEDSP